MFKKTSLVILPLLALLLVLGSLPAAADDALAEMDALYAKRDGTGNNARQVLALAEKAFAENPSYDVAWRAARACFWVCDRTENTKIDTELGLKGAGWAEKAIELNAAAVEGHYFRTLCLGEYGKGIGIPRALLKGVGGKFESSGEKAISIKAGYDFGGPLRAMGRYYQMLPWMKRDLDKAEAYYKRSNAVAPCATRTYFYLVELYVQREDYAAARAIADQGLATTACPDFSWETGYYKTEIKKQVANFPAQ